MTGALGTMLVVLLEAAVGGVVVLWLVGVQREARTGFTVLVGAVLAGVAWGVWLLGRAAVADARTAAAAGASDPSVVAVAGAAGDRLLVALLAFAALLTLWLVLVVALDDQHPLAKAAGVAGAMAGVTALGLTGAARGTDVTLAVGELLAGALFLGSAVYGLLLGHWYLFQRRLDEAHMRRGARLYAAGVAGGAATVALSALNPEPTITAVASPLLTIPGFSLLLGGGLLAVCALIAPFVWRLAKEGGRSIQAATGYFYLAVVMALSAEMAAKFRFFF